FQFFTSHSDVRLISSIREGRKKEFEYFNWQEEVPDPQSEETFEQCILSWNLEDPDEAILFKYYQFLIRFRKNREAMQARERNSLTVLPEAAENVICFERRKGGDRLLIVLSFNKQVTAFENPFLEPLRKIFDSSARE